MDARDWQRVNEIVVEALELAPEQRSAFLDEQCCDAPNVRREVESLLAAEGDAANFLDSPAVENYASFFESSEREEAEALLGQKIGNYRIIGELGHGGMGAVYLAERSDGKFEQRVALKLLKREMNTTALRKHFEQERKILAALQHPNIARLLDAGATRDRVPFLVMEYVEGLPIDDYCSSKDLTLDERLDLFRKVCAAVDFAHRNLIIHRDLKPSNILVTSDGTPVLLDFGISKILSEKLEDSDSRTITRMGVMTPQYASPEQLKNESVTTATDVYSLGVILYELLAGRRPFQSQETNMTDIFRAVIEQDPAPPSAVAVEVSRAFTAPAGQADTAAQRGRRTAPQIRAVRAQRLRGDLDNIALKTLKKEPERRYSSVEKLGDDIHRYQRGLPVSARADTFAYRAQKFFGRNRTAVIAGGLVAVALLVGVGATLWQWRVARAESVRTKQAAAKADKINSFLQDVLNFSNPHWLSSNPKRNRDATVAQAMDEALNRIDTELAGEPEIQAEIMFTLCRSYAVQGNFQKGEELARRAIAGFDEALGPGSTKSQQVAVILADILYLTGRFDEAETYYLGAIEHFRPLIEKDPSQIKWLAIALNDLGNVYIYHARFRDAEAVIRESTELARRITGRDRYALPVVLGNRGAALFYLNDFRGAIEQSLLALEAIRELGTERTFESGVARAQLAKSYTILGEYEESDRYHREAEEILVNSVGTDNIYTLLNRYNTADNWFRQGGRHADALKLAEETLANQNKAFPNGHFTISFTKRLLGEIYTATGQLAKGERELRDALEILAKSVKEPNHEISYIKTSLGENLIAQKRAAEARDVLENALDGYLRTRGDNNPFTDRTRGLLASITAK